MGDIRLHIDTLEYTGSGLRTRSPIGLQVGQHNRVVLVRPQRSPALAATYGGFPSKLSFPTPAVASALVHEHSEPGSVVSRLAHRATGSTKLQVFGHSDASGSEAENKDLTDRRAACVLALLKNDARTVVSIAASEQWGLELQQVMLRALDCDPGPIDGRPGVLTTAAIEAFQTSYAAGSYHRGDEAPLQPALVINGKLDTETQEAIVDAYVSEFSPRLPESSFLSGAPSNGCAFHNPAMRPDDSRNRRVSLVLHPGELEHPDAAPCTTGEAERCAVVGNPSGHTCMWYREHVVECQVDSALHHHFRPSWLLLTNGRYMLSVLTTVPDGDTVEFEVFAATQRVAENDSPNKEMLGKPIGQATSCTARLGIAQVVWDPPPDFTLNDHGELLQLGEVFHPVFRARHSGSATTGYGPTPRPGVVLFATDVPEDFPAREELRYRLYSDDGSYDMTLSAADATASDGYLDLYFRGLPKRARYTMTVTEFGGSQTHLFDKIPFSMLETLSDVSEDQLLDPGSEK